MKGKGHRIQAHASHQDRFRQLKLAQKDSLSLTPLIHTSWSEWNKHTMLWSSSSEKGICCLIVWLRSFTIILSQQLFFAFPITNSCMFLIICYILYTNIMLLTNSAIDLAEQCFELLNNVKVLFVESISYKVWLTIETHSRSTINKIIAFIDKSLWFSNWWWNFLSFWWSRHKGCILCQTRYTCGQQLACLSKYIKTN